MICQPRFLVPSFSSIRRYWEGHGLGGTMKRLFVQPRSLVLVAVLAVIAGICSMPAASAAPTGGGAGGGAAMGATTSHSKAASNSPCNFQGAQTCQSTDPTVTVSTDQYGDTSNCTFVWDVDWGDGQSSSNVLTDPSDGWVVLAHHKYKATGTYTISLTGQVTAGNCTVTDFSRTFTLLAPPPPVIHWSKTSGRAGTLITLTGKGWIPGGTVQIHQPEKKLFLGITTWTVDSHGNWKHYFAEQDAPPGTYKFSFTETPGQLRVTGSFRVLDPPKLTDRFSNWVDACYHGKLKSDALCTDALDEAAHLNLSFTSIFSCLTELKHGVKSGIAVCLIEDGIGVVTWVYKTWKSWWTHKPRP
jgi:PKD domain